MYLESITGAALQPNAEAKFYHLGDDLFPDLLADLETAQHFIFLEYFIVDHGVFWDSIVEVLRRKAAAGVDVRVLYDDLGSISTYTAKDAWQLHQYGIRCVAFNPLLFVRGTLNCRDRRKMTIIDGRVAYTGGVNLADEYINRVEKFGHWKDFGLRLEGPAATNYTRMFARFWDAFSNDPIPPERLAAPDFAPCHYPDGYVLSYSDSPLRATAASNELYIELLGQAREYAYFFTPYLMLGDSLLDELHADFLATQQQYRAMVLGENVRTGFFHWLLDGLNRCGAADPRRLLQAVQADIHAFVGTADPFDDITMLALEMKKMAHHYRLELAPTLEELPRAVAFVEESLGREAVPQPLVYKLNVAVDEIFSNIARYSGAARAAIVCFVQDGKATLRFEDDGKPFDPLAAANPDTTLPAQDRDIGGLGVFLVKRTMDEMRYERRQEKNCLTLALHLPDAPQA